jgi:PAS domain S-box-containing protein
MQRSAAELVRSIVERLTTRASKATSVLDWHPQDEATLRRVLTSVPGIVFRCGTDPARTMEFVSQGSRDVTGFDPRDLLGNHAVSYGSLIHADDQRWVLEELDRAVASRRPYRLTYRIRRVDGRERSVREYGQPIARDNGSFAIEGFVADIAELAEIQERSALQETRYRELAEGSQEVAHDLNNALAVIKATAQVLLAERSGDEALARDLTAILSAVDRGAALRGRILSLHKTGESTETDPPSSKGA